MAHKANLDAVAKLENLQKSYDELERIFDGIRQAMGLDIDGPLHDAVWRLFDISIDEIAENIGVDLESLRWFAMDNDFGRKGYTSQWPGQEPVRITGIEEFLLFEGLANED